MTTRMLSKPKYQKLDTTRSLLASTKYLLCKQLEQETHSELQKQILTLFKIEFLK